MSSVSFPTDWRGKICVLIDDDSLMRTAWAYRARSVGVILHVFEAVKEFLDSVLAESLDRDTWIFVDSQLGDHVPSGELAALGIHDRGFKSICLATGYEPASLNPPKWISRVIGKEPPF